MAYTHMDHNKLVQEQMTVLDRLRSIPWALFMVATLLGAIGVLMLFTVAGGSWEPWALAHMRRLAMILPLGILIALVDIRIWFRLAYPIYAVSLVLLILVRYLGDESNNAVRWIDLGFMQLQPSEIAQVALALVLARYFHGVTHKELANPLKLLLPIAFTILPFGLVMTQPDLGTSLKMLMIAVAVFFAAGVRWWKFLVVGLVVAAVPFTVINLGWQQFVDWNILEPYQVTRILTLFECVDIQDECYQIFHSLTAIGNGGLLGQGLGKGSQIQNDFLPEAQTDFILAAIGEEMGFAGVMFFFVVQVTLLSMALVIAMSALAQFARLLAMGLMFNLFLYLFINAGMIASLLPVVGVPLPLVSYGGTAMLVATGIIGLLGSIWIHRKVPIERLAGEKDHLRD